MSAETRYAGGLKAPFNPKPVSDADVAFGAKCRDLMPAMADIPREFKGGSTPWNDVFNKWFFQGFDARALVTKPGIDRKLAFRHLKAFVGSWEPSHEHKEAAAAFLLSLWFEPLPEPRKHKEKSGKKKH